MYLTKLFYLLIVRTLAFPTNGLLKSNEIFSILFFSVSQLKTTQHTSFNPNFFFDFQFNIIYIQMTKNRSLHISSKQIVVVVTNVISLLTLVSGLLVTFCVIYSPFPRAPF